MYGFVLVLLVVVVVGVLVHMVILFICWHVFFSLILEFVEDFLCCKVDVDQFFLVLLSILKRFS